MNIVEKVLHAQEVTKHRINTEKDKVIEFQKIEALNEVCRFILSCNYVTDPKSREKLRAFLYTYFTTNNYLIMKTSDRYSQVLKILRQDPSNDKDLKRVKHAINVVVLSNLKKLERMVGISTVDLILAGQIEKGLVQFREGTKIKATFGIVVKGVELLLPEPKESTVIKPENCTDVLFYFKSISRKEIKNTLEGLGMEKISFLRYILESEDSKYHDIRRLFMDFITGKVTIEAVIKELEA
ncbi:hypothetical protein G9F72_019210 [Clostridium estertheticum]|uniref:hypothetical protein n=1 Tax=Clostridium estertheticum TaxID=238834 RepID=UPI0013E94E5B|nr:hypothetical protein [Clostridium estertheticum]MBZ9688462.1 hypothetical protein [Clostridium estertheticum]